MVATATTQRKTSAVCAPRTTAPTARTTTPSARSVKILFTLMSWASALTARARATTASMRATASTAYLMRILTELTLSARAQITLNTTRHSIPVFAALGTATSHQTKPALSALSLNVLNVRAII